MRPARGLWSFKIISKPFTVVPAAVIMLYARRFLAGSFKFWEYLQQETTKCGFFLTDL